MNSFSRFTAITCFSFLSASVLFLPSANADNHSPQKDVVAKVSENAKDKAIIKTVDEAFHAIRKVQAARLAIFNGLTDDAARLVNEAKADMQKAKANAKDFAIKTNKSETNGEIYIPFDTSLTLEEGFKPTTEKQTAINKANEHLAKGEHKHAIKVLKTANIDVTIVAAMIPVNASLQHLDDASMLINEKKFYEANLVLKAIQDSVTVDGYSIEAVPEQGKKH